MVKTIRTEAEAALKKLLVDETFLRRIFLERAKTGNAWRIIVSKMSDTEATRRQLDRIAKIYGSLTADGKDPELIFARIQSFSLKAFLLNPVSNSQCNKPRSLYADKLQQLRDSNAAAAVAVPNHPFEHPHDS